MSAPLPHILPVLAQASSNAALITFLIYTLAVFGLAAASNILLRKKSFLSEYFLGSRSLGVWAFALTFAATSSSGGSFTGFPSKIYTHGWVLALWIGSYMVVPICTMGLLGKRLNQIARISGSITVPDVIRDRFLSAKLGLLAFSLIVFFMSFNLVAQFKAGSLILQTLLNGVEPFSKSAVWFGQQIQGIGFLENSLGPEYLLCLFTFGLAVIIYTTYGGFRAVVWTDVMQGVVMVVGVLILLPLAISQVGGMDNATRQMAEMSPPRRGRATLLLAESERPAQHVVPMGTWVTVPNPDGNRPQLLRVITTTVIPPEQNRAEDVAVLEIVTPGDIDTVLSRVKAGHEQLDDQLSVVDIAHEPYEYGTEPDRKGVYVTGPGPSPSSQHGFLPLSLAISFFFMWAISGSGQPSNMVRLMAFKDSTTLRRAIFTVAIYYTMIYFPLVLIFCCARVLMPGMEAESDRIMPAMARFLTENIGWGWLAGLLVAAPFAAVMSTVDSFLLMISSALVRDIYQRNINPEASERIIKRLSYLFTLLVGSAAMLGAVNPPDFLQDIIVYTGSGLAASFLGPMVFALYWPRVNTAGAMSGMIAGFTAHLSMYFTGMFVNGSFFRPYRFMNFDPIIVGLVVSFTMVVVVTKLTPPPSEKLVRKFFCKSK